MHRHATGVQFRTDIDPPATVPATPVVRTRAEERGIDLDTVRGSGVAGRVRLADLASSPATSRVTDRAAGSANTGIATVVVEADVTRWVAEAETPLRAHVVAAVLDAAASRVATVAVAVPDAQGDLHSVEVPNATELSAGGLERAMAVAEQQGPSSGSAPAFDAPVLTVVEAMAGTTLDLPIVAPAPAMTVSVGQPELRVVPMRGGEDRAIAFRDFVSVTIAWDPTVVPRSLITHVVPALRAHLERDRPVRDSSIR